mgnify:FL=1
MIKIKNIIFLILAPFIYFETLNADMNDSLFMTIGDKPITQSDLVNEIKLILILTNQSYSDDKRDQLHKIAIESTVKRTVKLIELERNNYFNFNQEDFEKELNRLASNIFVDLETLKNICQTNELDFSIVENQVKIELYWNSLIFEMYKNQVSINPKQIEERKKLIQNEKKIEEYLISEIVIKTDEKNKIESEIENLRSKIKAEGFENVARNISISESSIQGGDLGWLNENIVSDKVKSALSKTPVGSISEPVILSEGILIFMVRDKRSVDMNLSVEEIKNQIVHSEKNKILNMHSKSHFDKVRRSIAINIIYE